MALHCYILTLRLVGILASAAALQIADVVAGATQTCILTTNGSAMCWGENNYGQLGYGHTNHLGDDELPYTFGFINTGGIPLQQIAAGQSHACAITTIGSVLCWGRGALGALGYGNTANIGDNEMPIAAGFVSLPAGALCVQVVAGYSHTCARMTNGSVTCWGENTYGQLGYGHTNTIGDNELPSVAGFSVLGGAMSVIAASARAYHTCGIRPNGLAQCWGMNDDGQLGYGHINTDGSVAPSFKGVFNLGMTFPGIWIGSSHTCAVFTNGSTK
jgi:alpha-tubulin suppressor-like RCC1 family protein